MLVKVDANLLALLRLLVGNSCVSFLELAVLSLILARNLLVLLADDLGFGSTILVLQRLLIEELLVDL